MVVALRIAGAAALLAVLYGAAGWWLAPGLVRDALAEQAAARGLELRLAEVGTHPFGFSIELQGIEVLAGGRSLASAEALSADLAWASLWRDAWIVQRAELRSPAMDLRHELLGKGDGGAGQGKPVVVQQLLVTGGRLQLPRGTLLENLRVAVQDLSTAPAAEPARYEASATAAGGNLRSQGDVSLEPLAARGTLSAEALPLAAVMEVAVPGFIGGSAAYAYEESRLAFRDIVLHAEPEAGGRVTAQGAWARGAGQLQIAAEALPIALAQPFLPGFVDVRIVSGRAFSKGSLEIGDGFRYAGSLRVADLRLEERDSKQLLVAWREARTPKLRLTRDALELGEIAAEAPEARVVIEEGGRLNFAAAFAGGDGGEGEGGFRVAFERLRVSGGTLHFADRTLESAFEATVVDLAGNVTGFSTAPGDPASVQLNGRVQPYGTARIRGTIDLGAPTSLASIRARLRNLRLEAFNPYVAKFAGYRIASGRVSAELRYELKDGRLVGNNDLVFEEMRLGEKLASPGALDLPLELAIALLADDEGRITLDIPVSGNLRDPKFDFGAIVARAVGNTLRRVVSAPFRALAALVGGRGDDLGAIAFAPGRAELSPPAQEDVARIADALSSRPRLAVAVHAGYDTQRDLMALRLRAARDEVAVRAGVDQRGPLDFEDPKVRRAAERLFLQRGGRREELASLRETEGDYGRALVRRIAEALPIGETSVDILAQARAETVRAALIEQGVDPGRVRIEAPRTKPAGEDGVRTELALLAEGSAAAGR